MALATGQGTGPRVGYAVDSTQKWPINHTLTQGPLTSICSRLEFAQLSSLHQSMKLWTCDSMFIIFHIIQEGVIASVFVQVQTAFLMFFQPFTDNLIQKLISGLLVKIILSNNYFQGQECTLIHSFHGNFFSRVQMKTQRQRHLWNIIRIQEIVFVKTCCCLTFQRHFSILKTPKISHSYRNLQKK